MGVEGGVGVVGEVVGCGGGDECGCFWGEGGDGGEGEVMGGD